MFKKNWTRNIVIFFHKIQHYFNQHIKLKTEIRQIKKSGLFDKKWYLETYPDVKSSKFNPIKHYLLFGAKESRNPSYQFNEIFYPDNYHSLLEADINPLLHHLKFKKDIFLNKKLKLEAFTLRRKTKSEIAIIIHLFYPKLINELLHYLNNIKTNVNFYITYPEEKSDVIEPFLSSFPKNTIAFAIPNKGYDIYPFLRLLPILKNVGYRIFCKIHTKRDHPNFGSHWRESLLDGVLGNEKIINTIIKSFHDNPNLAFVGSGVNYLSYYATKYNTQDKIKYIQSILNILIDENKDWGFIAGSMFWGNLNAFQTFGNARLADLATINKPESGLSSDWPQALERCFGIPLDYKTIIGLVDYENSELKLLLGSDLLPIQKTGVERYIAYKNRQFF